MWIVQSERRACNMQSACFLQYNRTNKSTKKHPDITYKKTSRQDNTDSRRVLYRWTQIIQVGIPNQTNPQTKYIQHTLHKIFFI
ncbi:MAG: hypothetical protein LBQ66_16605, partial [Planctomycetaceae bacterium]|nr:hypothetical protein [Planctomycetaceae bacterium]